jgi:hypothetical protein
MVARKLKLKFFNPKHLKNHDKPINDLKKPPKKNSTRNQKSTRVQICFFMNFKGKKKTSNMNSHNQMKYFDTNIIHFSSLNRCQRHVFLFTAGIRQPLSLSPFLIRDQKITKINFCTKLKLKKY